MSSTDQIQHESPPQISSKWAEILEDYYSEDELARGLNKTPRTLRRWKQRGLGPPATRLGNKIFYHRESVRRWLASREETPPREKRRRA